MAVARHLVEGDALKLLALMRPRPLLSQPPLISADVAALEITEGVGLFYRKRWAEWLTVVATSLLVPIEVYELVTQAVQLLGSMPDELGATTTSSGSP